MVPPWQHTIMAVRKISVSVNEDTLREIHALAGDGINLSALVDEGLTREVNRRRMLAVLDDMDARNPISKAGLLEGERLWQAPRSRSLRTPPASGHSPRRAGDRTSSRSDQDDGHSEA
jgi:post-segregation antitoxin (ccd killing protein)